MAALVIPDYRVILHDLSNNPIMDISNLCKPTLTYTLNDIDTLQFEIDTAQLEAKCLAVGTTPRQVLYPNRTEIKVYRNGTAAY